MMLNIALVSYAIIDVLTVKWSFFIIVSGVIIYHFVRAFHHVINGHNLKSLKFAVKGLALFGIYVLVIVICLVFHINIMPF
ncbi:hypothetical protein [Staphylococcus pasteuri]|uniref:hypothetical protein n=1 Tax=Staphylococcus pasteuri TaxID=45972 RepID=UPI0012B8636E|nr:hypothetical protein [Staphylococcus pasteuri]